MPEVHVRARAGAEVPGGRQNVQHMWGQGALQCVQAVQEEEEGSEESQGGAERDLQREQRLRRGAGRQQGYRDQVWPGTCATTRKRYVRHIVVEDVKSEDESESSDGSDGEADDSKTCNSRPATGARARGATRPSTGARARARQGR